MVVIIRKPKPKKNPHNLVWFDASLTERQVMENNYKFWKWEIDNGLFRK